jgi:hypothetical protein
MSESALHLDTSTQRERVKYLLIRLEGEEEQEAQKPSTHLSLTLSAGENGDT